MSRALAADAPDGVWGPMRWVQVNFTEDDPGRFDPRFWLGFMRRTNTHGACLNAGGIVAFYPTKGPFHHLSPYLGVFDPFGDMAKACKAMGLRVLGRVDPSVMRPDAVAAHPDWVARTAAGEPQIHPHDPSLFLSCPDGPVSFEWMPQVIREIVSTYPVDGIFYQGLLEARVPFRLVDDRELNQAVLGQYQTIVLPNIAAMSDQQAATIRDYVANGGAIVATGETSLYDEQGVQRKNFALADLFGADYAGKVDRKVENSYISIEGPHPLTAGLDETPRIIGGTRLVHVTPHATEGRPPLRLIRSYPTLPAETAYPREPVSDVPMAYAHAFGKGRVVYFPFNLDEAFWEHSAKDHLYLLRNAVAWGTGKPQPMTVSGAGLVDVSYWRQAKSLAAHLVNLNNPSTMAGYIRETVPIGPFVVSLELPTGARARRVRLLEAERDAKTRREGNRLIVDVPRVRIYEVIAVDLV